MSPDGGNGWTGRGERWQDGGMETHGKFSKAVLADLLGAKTRLSLLEELSKGGLFSVSELAEVVGVTATMCSKHMRKLARAGVVVSGKGRLYSVAPGILAEGGGRVLRLGRCTLDFGGAAEEA